MFDISKHKQFLLDNATDLFLIILISVAVYLRFEFNTKILLNASFIILFVFTCPHIIDMYKSKRFYTKCILNYMNESYDNKYLFLIRNTLLYSIYYYLFIIADYMLGVAIISVMLSFDLLILSGMFSKTVYNKVNNNKNED